MVADGVVLASVILLSARGRLPRGRAVVFGNSSHLSSCLRIEDLVKSALVIVMSSGRHNRLPPRDDEIGYGKPLVSSGCIGTTRNDSWSRSEMSPPSSTR